MWASRREAPGVGAAGRGAAAPAGGKTRSTAKAVKRHPELAPGRHEELTPRVSGVKQAASERAIHSAVASERLAVVRAALKFFSPTLFRLQQVFAEARCGAFALSGSCHRGS